MQQIGKVLQGAALIPGPGRPKGRKNNATLERERIALEVATKVASGAMPSGVKVLEDLMLYWARRSMLYRPALPDDPPNSHGDEDKFKEASYHAGKFAGELAPYQTPRLQAAVVQVENINPFDRMTDEELYRELQRRAADLRLPGPPMIEGVASEED